MLAPLAGAANLGSNFAGAKIVDATTWGLFAKYRINLGGSIPIITAGKGGAFYKANAPVETFTPSLTISGGYENIRLANPADGGWGVGHATIGGFQIGPVVTTTGLPSAGIVNNGFTGGDKVTGVPFVTVRYTWTPNGRLQRPGIRCALTASDLACPIRLSIPAYPAQMRAFLTVQATKKSSRSVLITRIPNT